MSAMSLYLLAPHEIEHVPRSGFVEIIVKTCPTGHVSQFWLFGYLQVAHDESHWRQTFDASLYWFDDSHVGRQYPLSGLGFWGIRTYDDWQDVQLSELLSKLLKRTKADYFQSIPCIECYTRRTGELCYHRRNLLDMDTYMISCADTTSVLSYMRDTACYLALSRSGMLSGNHHKFYVKLWLL